MVYVARCYRCWRYLELWDQRPNECFRTEQLTASGNRKRPEEFCAYFSESGLLDVCVLLVEDQPLIREMMSEALRDAGHDVLEMESGDLAIEMLRDPPKQFTVLVTDFHMPGDIDGSQVAACVRKRHAAIPVVIVSGRPDVLQAAWRKNFGYNFLRKPFLPSELVKLVGSLVGPKEA